MLFIKNDMKDLKIINSVKRMNRLMDKDAIQFLTFAAHVRWLMAENPELKLILVLR